MALTDMLLNVSGLSMNNLIAHAQEGNWSRVDEYAKSILDTISTLAREYDRVEKLAIEADAKRIAERKTGNLYAVLNLQQGEWVQPNVSQRADAFVIQAKVRSPNGAGRTVYLRADALTEVPRD